MGSYSITTWIITIGVMYWAYNSVFSDILEEIGRDKKYKKRKK